MKRLLIAGLLLLLSGITCVSSARTLYVTDVGHEDHDVSLADRLAALACQGLMNRKENQTIEEDEIAVYTLKEGWDVEWLETAMEQDPTWEQVVVPNKQFVNEVCAARNFPKMLYSKELHHEIIPQLITLAGVLDAVPLDVDSGIGLV